MRPKNQSELEWFELEIAPYEENLRAWLKKKFPAVKNCDDIMQEGYLRVINRQRLKPIQFPKAFLFTICRNLAIDVLRTRKIVSFENLRAIELESVLASGENQVREKLSEKENSSIVWEAIDQLPKKCRTIFILRKINDYSLREIAQKMNLSNKTVEVQISIAIRKCKKYIEKYEKELNP